MFTKTKKTNIAKHAQYSSPELQINRSLKAAAMLDGNLEKASRACHLRWCKAWKLESLQA